jgi:hypothetical protein
MQQTQELERDSDTKKIRWEEREWRVTSTNKWFPVQFQKESFIPTLK